MAGESESPTVETPPPGPQALGKRELLRCIIEAAMHASLLVSLLRSCAARGMSHVAVQGARAVYPGTMYTKFSTHIFKKYDCTVYETVRY
jgi:hypothetical protein